MDLKSIFLPTLIFNVFFSLNDLWLDRFLEKLKLKPYLVNYTQIV